MATTMRTSGAASADYDMSLWYDSKYYKIGLGLMLAVAIFW
ncbi:methane/ammonia monooxygenase subunit C, partial [Nitrosomonas marina]